MLLSTLPAAPSSAAPPDVGELRVRNPDALVPGSVTPMLDTDPPGYLVCSLVARYFDDETAADLRLELDLSARQQFVRFMTIDADEAPACFVIDVSGFQNLGMWWEDECLHGLYFVPVEGVHPIGENSGGAPQAATRDAPPRPTPADLLLEARTLRKKCQFDQARSVLGQLRKEYPVSPEARRALRELYFVNTAESRPHANRAGE